MEDSLFAPTVTNRVHKEAAIQIGAFLGGPLVAGYLIAHNFRQLGEPEKVRKTWLWAIVFFIVLVVLAVTVPQSVPPIVFAAVNAGVAHLFVQRYQSTRIKAHLEAGGPVYKTWRAALIGLVCSGVLILLILIGLSLTDLYRLTWWS